MFMNSYVEKLIIYKNENLNCGIVNEKNSRNFFCVRRNNLDICSRRISRRQLSTANEDIRKCKKNKRNT